MKKITNLLIILLLGISFNVFSQTIVFQENFEGTTQGLTSSSAGITSWGLTNAYSASGNYADSAIVSSSPVYLTTTSFSTLGKSSVMFEFSHIAKIYLTDNARIEVSLDNGLTWTGMTGAHYLGTSDFGAQGNRFHAGSYALHWDYLNGSTVHDSMFVTENFDISLLAANEANVQIRFALVSGTLTAPPYYGWLIDDIKITGYFSELDPPALSVISPLLTDTFTHFNPVSVVAAISDASGIDTAYVSYQASTGFTDTVGMQVIGVDTFSADIPFFGFGQTTTYKVHALDASPAANMTSEPSIGTRQYYTKYEPSMANVVWQENFNAFPNGGTVCASVCLTANGWVNETTDDKDWSALSGSTGSSSTGPTGDHTSGSGKYMYTEASSCYNKVAELTSPSLNLDTIPNPMMIFYYHMYGTAMGGLSVDVYANGVWTNGVWTISGQQQTSSAEVWRKAEIDLKPFQSSTTKIRFTGTTGSGLTSDMAIDDITIGSAMVLATDIGVNQIINPQSGSLAGSNINVEIELTNFGSDTLNTATINWDFDSIAQTDYSWTGTLLPDSSVTVIIGTVNLVAGQHVLRCSTESPNGVSDMNLGNDESINSFYVCSSVFSGSYTVGGVNPDFANMATAISAFNQCGVGGPVIVNIADGTYTEQFEIGTINGVSSTNTITFQSASGDSSLVILQYIPVGASDNYIAYLNGADYLIFKDLTFSATSSRLVTFQDAPNHLEFSNCVFENTVHHNAVAKNDSDPYKDLVYTIDSLGNDIGFYNCVFKHGNYALRLIGNPNNHSTDWKVVNCRFSETAHRSIFFQYGESALALENQVSVSNAKIFAFEGVGLTNCTGSCIVNKNKFNIQATYSAHAVTFSFCDGDTAYPHLMINNFVYFDQSSTGHWGCAINIFSSTYVGIYHNSVSVTGNYTNTSSFQIYDGNPSSTPSSNIYLKNNIFTNSISGGKLFRFVPVSYTKFTNDYNILYSYGVGSVTPQASTFSAWKTVTGGGSHSQEYAPYYTSSSDLHVNTNQLNGTGIHVDGVIDDIDSDLRDTLTPDIGADEFVPSPYDPGVIEILTPVSACGLNTNEQVTVLIINYGSADIQGNITVGYTYTGLATPVSVLINDTIAAGDTLQYSFVDKANLDVSTLMLDQVFEIKVWASYPSDNFKGNDTLTENINSFYQPPTPIVSDVVSTYATTASLSATSSNVVWWFDTDTASVPVGVGLFTTPILYDTTQYWVSAQATSCASTKAVVSVNVVGFPPLDAGVSSIAYPTVGIPSGVQQILKVNLNNFGTNPLTGAEVHWDLNGQHDSIIWVGPLAPNTMATIEIDTVTFVGGLYNLRAWTSMPNNTADTINTNDTSAVVTFNACLTGSYTIGDTTGGAVFDFPSFTSAVSSLSAGGICDTVTFLVDAGIYEERVTFPDIMSADTNARIVFTSASGDSSDVTLRYTLNSSAEWVIKLSGSYYTFKNITLSSLGSTSNGRVVEFNSATNNEFFNCVIEGVIVTSSSSDYALVYNYGGGNDYNTFESNLFLNGSTSLYLYGSSSNLNKGTIIRNNVLQDFYTYGSYLYYHKNLQFNSNSITNGSSTSAYGARFYYADNCTVTNNTIRLDGSSSNYGMYFSSCDGSTSNPNFIANNMLSVSGSSTSIWYGLYMSSCTKSNVYYNSVNLASGSATSRGLYIASGSDNNVINNIFSNSGGGYSIYVSSPASLASMDYNDLYSSGSSLAYWSGAKTDLAALQASSSKDLHSVSVSPFFVSDTNLHIMSTHLSGLGIAIPSVSYDIDGELRSQTPTIGAHEIPLIPIDAGISEIILPVTNAVLNENDNQGVSVIVKNFGTDTLFTFNVQYSVNNANHVTVVYSDTLLSFEEDTLAMPDFLVPTGNSAICIKTVLATDTNLFNDEMCSPFFGTPRLDASLTHLEEIQGGCGLSTDTIKAWIHNIGVDTIDGSSITFTAHYQLDGVSTVVNDVVTLQINPGDSALFTFATLADFTVTTTDSIFDVKAWVRLTGDNVFLNDTAETVVTSYYTPPLPVVSPVNIPYATSVSLSAISTSNDSLFWYDTDTSLVKLCEGEHYVTPIMYATDTFYVAALSGIADLKITEVTQFNTGTGATSPKPAWLVGDDFVEISNLGSAPAHLTGLVYHREGSVANYSLTYNLPSIVLVPGEVIVLATYGATNDSPANNFYVAGSYSVSSGTLTGHYITDASGTVLDAVALNNYSFSGTSGVTALDWSGSIPSSSGKAGVIRSLSDNNNASDWILSTTTTLQTIGALNSNLGSQSSGGCISARTPLIVTVGAQIANDVGVLSIDEPVNSIYLTSNEKVKVTVKNFGSVAQSNIPVSYKLDNGNVVLETIVGPVPANGTYVHTFATTADLSQITQTYQLVSYTSHNGDVVALNDSISTSVENIDPVYCNSTATSTSYHDIGRVEFAGINNTSPLPYTKLYTDYTNLSPAIIAPGDSYVISVDVTSSNTYAYAGYCEVYIDYNRDGVYTESDEIAFASAYTGVSSTNTVTLTDTVFVPANALVGLSQLRVVLARLGTANSVTPCGTYTYGETEDYMTLIAPKIPQDAGVLKIVTPSSVASNSITPLIVEVRNYGLDSITSVDVFYELNSGTPVSLTYTQQIDADSVVLINLGNITLNQGVNYLCVYTVLAGDINIINDEKCMSVYIESSVNSPYYDDFEQSDIWFNDTLNTQWERGNPSGVFIDSAYSGANAWVTKLSSSYVAPVSSAGDYLYSPKIHVTGFDSVYVSFWHKMDMDAGTADRGMLQVSVDGGVYGPLGYYQDPKGSVWYNKNASGIGYWNFQNQQWQKSEYTMVLNDLTLPYYLADTLQFRFVFVGNGSTSKEGWAIDDFALTLPVVPIDAGVVTIDNPGMSTAVGDVVQVKVTVENFGSTPIASLPVTYQLGNGIPITEIFTPTTPLALGDSEQFTFTTTYVAGNIDYQLCAYTELPLDQYPSNDKKCRTITADSANFDVGCVIDWPTAGDETNFTYDPYVYVSIINYGKQAVTSIPLEYTVNTGQVTNDTWTGNLAPGQTVQYMFTVPYNSVLGLYTLCAKTQLATDANIANDKKCESINGVAVGIDNVTSENFTVKQNQPNPATNNYTIGFSIPTSGDIHFELRNSLGQLIEVYDQQAFRGGNSLQLNANRLNSGIYFYTLEFRGVRKTMRMIVNK